MRGRERKCRLLEKDRMCGIWKEVFWFLVCMWSASNTISPLKTWHNSGTQRNISKEGRKRPFVTVAKLLNLQSLRKSTCPGHQLLIGAPKFSFSCFPRTPDTVQQRSTTFLLFSVISPYWMPSRWPSVSSAVSPAGPDTSPAPPASPLPASGRAPLNCQMLQIHMLEVCCGTAMKTATCYIL